MESEKPITEKSIETLAPEIVNNDHVEKKVTEEEDSSSSSSSESEKLKNVVLVVLGDIGRSARMQYHALSLASNGYHVDIVGQNETALKQQVLDSPDISIADLTTFPPLSTDTNTIVFTLYAFLKIIYQIVQLIVTLCFTVDRPKYIIVQNPPSIPVLAIVKIVCAIRRTEMIIDWHNYGYSILAMRLGEDSSLVKIAKDYEKYFGQMASKNICVTDKMAKDLSKNWGIKKPIVTLHDKAPKSYKKLSTLESVEFWTELFSSEQLKRKVPDSYIHMLETVNGTKTIDQNGRSVGKPLVLTTGTSWTADEDLYLMLNSLKQYNEETKNDDRYPNLLVIITGKGPMQQEFEKTIEYLVLEKVFITTAWLSPENYPRLLGSADLGVSLHKSSSGLDLPMKIVDMFGCGLPVLSYKFNCIEELVKPGVNGEIFESSEELTKQLKVIAENYLDNGNVLRNLQIGAEEFKSVSWEENWDQLVLPMLESKQKKD
ncbi:hypothetical protein BB558_005351 [Smittium angustum]|uniref:Chitobiosyldiphosphodolichol beta-mannosyltransferase n=1 Tax=Smittium angustum TaxID=133377 RepID=A0A2U1J0R2_SMIAN|nr:hypothetical protein BB558_005351 [Smittium angustum]